MGQWEGQRRTWKVLRLPVTHGTQSLEPYCTYMQTGENLLVKTDVDMYMCVNMHNYENTGSHVHQLSHDDS